MNAPRTGQLNAQRLTTTLDEHPWWLWWNVLCLDAPVVALGWHLLALRGANLNGSLSTSAVLFSTVWSIYIVDHWLDARRTESLFSRHLFMRSGGRYLIFLAAILCLGCGCLIPMLPAPVARNGLVLILIVTCYMLAAHLYSRSWPSEIAVGIVFAAGSLLETFTLASERSHVLLQFSMFAGICILNCTLIEVHENPQRNNMHPSVRWLGQHGTIVGIVLGAAGVLLAVFGPHGTALAMLSASFTSALALSLLSASRDRLAVDAFRMLADAALMTPYLAFIFL